MIKANELRTGNKISERYNHRIYDVLAIDEFGVTVKYWSCGETEKIPFNKLVPVLLTPEILEKAGFKLEEGEDNIFETGNERWVSYTFSEGVFVPYDNFYHGFMPHLHYLHQLQNIYFAVTGEELTITL